MATTRLAVDIGGTFTDAVLSLGERLVTAKALTTQEAPEKGFVAAVESVLCEARMTLAEIDLILHGTTLAANAIIERKGAKVALLTTEGFRDSLEMAYEHRFEQSDLFMERPSPLVPRRLRLPVPERIAADGSVLKPLDERALLSLVPFLRKEGVEAVAVGFLHSYRNPAHERRAAALLREELPHLPLSLSSEISPEIREYDRFSTTVANAYVEPLMRGYLERLESALKTRGFAGELFLMMSSGGMTTVRVARALPVRLIESGPAGGALFASRVAAELGLPRVLSFDMGGTTAKIALIDDFTPQRSRNFEVARAYRFLKGSGFPLRIPVIDMVEIGAGGGSIARLDALRAIEVGPESAGADPGPACYGRGGKRPTVSDADLALGRIDESRFAGGIRPDPEQAGEALGRDIGRPLGLEVELAAAGVAEIVDENMANAARLHALESGKDFSTRTLVAFGGAAPLHAARIAEKLGIARFVVPAGAGVGSAIGFLAAPHHYEVVRSRYLSLAEEALDAPAINALLAEMRQQALAVVRLGAPDSPLAESRHCTMRYRGQGHEVNIELPNRDFEESDGALFHERFETAYRALYGRTIPRLASEILSWSLALSTKEPPPEPLPETLAALPPPPPVATRRLFDPSSLTAEETPVYLRSSLAPGTVIEGPALIAENETATVLPRGFRACVTRSGAILAERREE
jgi:N-methylhydantoinase A